MTLVLLTGAGMSAESGVPTFRDFNGYWARFDWRTLATPEAFAERPADVHEFYNMRRRALDSVVPNAAHDALARLDRALANRGEDFLLITQNVDDLHRRAGQARMIQMHGQLDRVRCAHCGHRTDWREDLHVETACPHCGGCGGMRPDIVWFGEMPYHLEKIAGAMRRVRHFVAIGTSGSVYPAAGLVSEARRAGARTTEINLEPAENADAFDDAHYGHASEVVPLWVENYLNAVPSY